MNGENRNAYRLLAGKSRGKRPLGRSKHRWVGNIKMDLVVIGWVGLYVTGSISVKHIVAQIGSMEFTNKLN
jgi:hypothetical protein